MNKGDIGSALALIGLALFVFYETAGYPESMVPGAPGPSFFPRLLAGLLVVFSLLILWTAVRSKAPATASVGVQWARLARSGATFLLTVVFLTFVERADFFLLLIVLLGSVMAVMGERRIRVLAVVPTVFSAFVYLVFFRLFGVPFPTIL